MKFSYSWLKELYPKLGTPDAVAKALTFHSFQVESVEKKGSDVVLDIDLLANRFADASAHVGIARELAVIAGKELKERKPVFREDSKERAGDYVSVKIESPGIASRYSARVVCNVKVGESPEWMKERLTTCGLRPINVVVDVTNYVMLETGQPLHAFDHDRLSGSDNPSTKLGARKTISVRFAKTGEKMATLGDDSTTLSLTSHDIVIADEKGPIGLAGIKGGKGSEIHNGTTCIVLEAANFNPKVIRTTSKRLGLRTDASMRFEHEPSPELTTRALDRAAELLLEYAHATVAKGVVDVYQKRRTRRTVPFSMERTNRLLGMSIPETSAVSVLKRFGCDVKKGGKGVFQVAPPYWRNDLAIEEDLIEEVGRIWGYEKIPALLPDVRGGVPKKSDERVFSDALSERLVGFGFTETELPSFVGDAVLAPYHIDSNTLFQLENPTSSDTQYMSSIPAIQFIRSIVDNQRNFDTIKVFEVATAFLKTPEGPVEEKRLLIGMSQKGKDGKEEFYFLKGVISALFESLGVTDDWYRDVISERHKKWAHPHRFAEIKVGDTTVGTIAELLPTVHEALKSQSRIVIVGITIPRLLAVVEKEREFRPIPKYPAIVRDVALIVSEDDRIQDVEEVMWEAAPEILIDIDLFDEYEGKGMPQEKKSLAFHLVFQASDRTLTDGEVDKHLASIVKMLESKKWEVRK